MKKFAILPLIILVIGLFIIGGCTKQSTTYSNELAGSWQVYKYLLHGTEATQNFQNAHKNYLITFTNNGKFTENYTTTVDTGTGGNIVADTVTIASGGTYSFVNNNLQIVLTDSVLLWRDTVLAMTAFSRTYTIFDLTASDVQLKDDTSQLYMNKTH